MFASGASATPPTSAGEPTGRPMTATDPPVPAARVVFGPDDIAAIREMCDARGIVLVEDAAHAHGSSHDGTMAGSFGAAGTFSFYPTKVITSGEGGMIVTADERLRDEALLYRDQGKSGFLGN